MSLTPEAHEARKGFLGASEIAAVAGVDPFGKTAWDIWGIKTGLLKPGTSDSRSQMGHRVEKMLLQWASDEQGVAITPNERTYRKGWMGATPDGLSQGLNVQCKAVGSGMAHHWVKGVPVYVQAQVQWEMLVCELPLTWVVAYLDPTEPQLFEVRANPQMQADLVDIGADFWRTVQNRTPPDIDGSEGATRVLAALYRKAEGLTQATQAQIELAIQRQNKVAERKRLDAEIDWLDNCLRQSCGTSEGFIWNEGRVTWKDRRGNPAYKTVCEQLGATEAQIEASRAAPERVLHVHVKGLK